MLLVLAEVASHIHKMCCLVLPVLAEVASHIHKMSCLVLLVLAKVASHIDKMSCLVLPVLAKVASHIHKMCCQRVVHPRTWSENIPLQFGLIMFLPELGQRIFHFSLALNLVREYSTPVWSDNVPP